MEDTYCRCVMHVAASYPRYNPYAVCTASVYTKKGLKRKGVISCSERLRYEDFKTEELRGYARMKKFPRAGAMSRDELIKTLYGYVVATKGKKVWQEYIKEYRKKYPNMSNKEILKKASEDYHKEKLRFLKT